MLPLLSRGGTAVSNTPWSPLPGPGHGRAKARRDRPGAMRYLLRTLGNIVLKGRCPERLNFCPIWSNISHSSNLSSLIPRHGSGAALEGPVRPVDALGSAGRGRLLRETTRIGEAMNRLRVEQDRSSIGHPDSWTVVEHHPRRGWNVVFRGTYCECLKRAEQIAQQRPLADVEGP
jgi:hypothetical protein